MFKCKWCNKREFEKNTSLTLHKGQCSTYKEFIKNNLTYDFLYNHLIKLKQSANYVASIVNKVSKEDIIAGTIIHYAKKHSIKTRNIKQSNNLKQVKDKRKLTCLKKYGTVNALSRGTDAYKKRNETVKSKYGVDNVFQLDEVKAKMVNTSQEKYGVDHPQQNRDIRNKAINTFIIRYGETPSAYMNKHSSSRRTKPHRAIERILESYSIKFISEADNIFFTGKTRYKNYKYYLIPDILIEDSKLVIEIYGDLYHGNPKFYKSTDVIYTGQKVESIWEKDKNSQELIKSYGYDVLIIWEHDIKEHLQKVEKLICKKLELNLLKK